MSDWSRSKSRPLQRGACRRRIGTCADIVALATTPKVGGESRRQTALLSRDNRAKVHRRYFCTKVTKLMSYDTIKIFKKDLYEGSHSCGFSALAKNELSLATLIGSPFG